MDKGKNLGIEGAGFDVDIIDAGVLAELIATDLEMMDLIKTVQEPIFVTLCVLNVSAGVEAIAMPWIAHFSAANVPDDYAPAAQRGRQRLTRPVPLPSTRRSRKSHC